MPTQVYSCPRHKEFDVSVPFSEDVPQTAECPMKEKSGRVCCEISKHILKTPAGVKFKRTWNEQANEARRDPYTQAKTAFENSYNEAKDDGMNPVKPTEKQLQAAAKKIGAGK